VQKLYEVFYVYIHGVDKHLDDEGCFDTWFILPFESKLYMLLLPQPSYAKHI